MTDNTVQQFASMFYTVEQIAELFNVSAETVLKHHGDAFRRGKIFHSMKPRVILDNAATAYANLTEEEWKDPKLGGVQANALKTAEIIFKKTEGYGQKTEVVHSGAIAKEYDKVESAPQIIERPDEDEE